jgi:sugar phosphate permease
LSGAGAVLMTICAIAPFSLVSLYIVDLAAYVNSTVGGVSLALSIATVGAIVGSLLIGRLLKVLGPRIMIIIAGICIFAFQFTMSVSSSIIPIYIVAFFNGFGTTWGGIAMAQIIITQWFAKGRGMMMSACMIIMGLALVVLIPVLGQLVATFTYRPVLTGVGIIAGAGVILSAFLVSGAPQKYGLQPLGAGEADADGAAHGGGVGVGLSWAKVVKNPVFWAIWLIVVLVTIVAQGFNSQAAVVFGDFGLGQMEAAFAFSLFSLLGLPLQFLFGFLCDKVGPKIALYLYGVLSAAVLLLSFLWLGPIGGWVGAIIFAVGMAFGGGLSGLYGPNMAPRLFGAKDAGDIIGFIVMGSSVGASIGPIVFGFMYDAFGNYTAALTVMGVILAVCLAINWWVNSKKNVEKIQRQIAEESAA